MTPKPYLPSNGTEGEWFMHKFCDNCYKCMYCSIMINGLSGKQPKQWIYQDNKPTCTSFNPERPKAKKKQPKGMQSLF